MREGIDCAHVLGASLLAEVRPATARSLCENGAIGCCTYIELRRVMLLLFSHVPNTRFCSKASMLTTAPCWIHCGMRSSAVKPTWRAY